MRPPKTSRPGKRGRKTLLPPGPVTPAGPTRPQDESRKACALPRETCDRNLPLPGLWWLPRFPQFASFTAARAPTRLKNPTSPLRSASLGPHFPRPTPPPIPVPAWTRRRRGDPRLEALAPRCSSAPARRRHAPGARELARGRHAAMAPPRRLHPPAPPPALLPSSHAVSFAVSL